MLNKEEYLARARFIDEVIRTEFNRESHFGSIKGYVRNSNNDIYYEINIGIQNLDVRVELDVSDWERIYSGEDLGELNHTYKVAYEQGEKFVEKIREKLKEKQNDIK